MTIANNYAPIRQLGDSGTTQYSAAWSMIAAAYAVVSLESVSTGVRTPLVQGVGTGQYQIAITSSGFTVTLGQPATSAFYVNVGRLTGLDQTDSYRTSKGFQGEVEENSFDKLTAMVQDAAYSSSQSLRIPSGETTTTALPSATNRANMYLAFDASGNVITTAGTVNVTPISAAMVPVVQAVSTAAALTLLGGISAATAAATYVPLTVSIPTIQRFASGSGTYTKPAGVKYLRVKMVGAGGGGGGLGASTAPTGVTGGDTIFNSIHAAGGVGGTGATTAPGGVGGAGGSAGTGTATLRVSGQSGADGASVSANVAQYGADGGSSPFFGGGARGPIFGNVGRAGITNTGGGGSGAGSSTTQDPSGGGGSGEYAEIIIGSPAATYAYVVGAGGAGGIGTGTNAQTGGAGAAGVIIVEEFYT